MSNRVITYAADIRARQASGLKPDGSPVGDLDDLDASLAISFGERAAYQDAQAAAHASGVLTADEALTVYTAIGESGSDANGGWPAGVDLALKVAVTALMGQLLGAAV